MSPDQTLDKILTSESFLEYAFLRWVLTPAVDRTITSRVIPQQKIQFDTRSYRIDYAITGDRFRIAVELDGFEFHGNRYAFSYDRLRQNDLHAAGWTVLRFSYDSIRLDTINCKP
jgi:very-short-patch-repair endonuclease